MEVTIATTPIRDLVVLEHQIFEDSRGFFMEVFRKDIFADHGLPVDFPQVNHSSSVKGVVRGLHFQWDPPMGKLMRVIRGAALLVAVDIRKGSPTLGRWHGEEVTAQNKKQVWAPAGFARGFCVLSDVAEIQYQCTGIYNAAGESGILWNDPQIGIDWPADSPQLSEKDQKAQTLAEWQNTKESDAFRY